MQWLAIMSGGTAYILNTIDVYKRQEPVGRDIYVDGAHNDDGIRELVRSVNRIFSQRDIYLIFAVAEDKDYQEMVRHLCGISPVSYTHLDVYKRQPLLHDQFWRGWEPGRVFKTGFRALAGSC